MPIVMARTQPRESFGDWLRGALHRRGWAQEYAARRMDVSVFTVNRWINGSKRPSYRQLMQVLRVLGELPPDFLDAIRGAHEGDGRGSGKEIGTNTSDTDPGPAPPPRGERPDTFW